ncbi:MAG: cytochrome c3 family protein [Proteobacteria bacterium]|nr:cytochrome c3 family protein [Pseudomonadota bacterium]
MQWRRRINLLLVVVLFAVIGQGVGCTLATRQKIMKVVFEDVPPPGQQKPPEPFVGHPRRQPVYEPPPPVMVLVKAYKPAFQYDWKALLLALPKDAVGGVDWVTALADGAIDPRTGIDPEHSPQQPVLPLNVQLEPENLPLFNVTFPHQQHTEWLTCDNCHPKIFTMRAGADPISMQKIYAGEYCGACHGKVAFEVATGCPRCHLALAGPQ